MKSVFKGSCVALVTPFTNGMIDYNAYGEMIDFQINSGTDAIVVLGTTGEPATISEKDRVEIIDFAVKRVGGRIKVIVGTGANSTRKAIENSVVATDLGADALLVVTPYYNKCTQKGLVEHYKMIASSTPLPIIVYNVPSRTGVNILPETAVELSQIDNICGIKEASGNIGQITLLCNLLKDKMAVYSGDDGLNYLFMTLGASGAISVTANVAPRKVKEILSLCEEGNYDEARNKQFALDKLNKDLFIEVNPIPVKYACYKMGLCSGEIRLPLTELEDKNKKIIDDDLFTLGII